MACDACCVGKLCTATTRDTKKVNHTSVAAAEPRGGGASRTGGEGSRRYSKPTSNHFFPPSFTAIQQFLISPVYMPANV